MPHNSHRQILMQTSEITNGSVIKDETAFFMESTFAHNI